jgi:hypothetical protein
VSGPDKLVKRPEFDSVEAAARVSSFMGAAEHGRWQINRFTIADHDVKRALGRNIGRSTSAEELDMRNARIVPPGEYVSLRRRATPEEGSALYEDGTPFDGWVPVMSDTPSEIHEHDDAFRRAHGNVVITGLGLGVVVSALLAKPEVEHITVVEVDRDVIALTGPYYEDETRVTIVNMDALEYAATRKRARVYPPLHDFDFAWHDIWSAISYRNMDDDSLAEHGISYQTMFDAYDPFCVNQSAWALAEAIRQGAIEDARYAKRQEFIRAWRAGTPEQRVELLVDGILRDHIGSFVAVDAEIPSDVREHLAGQMGLLAWAQTIVAENGFDIDKLERDLLTPETPMPRPNEAPEANVA